MGSMFGGSSASVAAERVVTPATAQAADKTAETDDAKAKRRGIVGSYSRFASVDEGQGGTSNTLG